MDNVASNYLAHSKLAFFTRNIVNIVFFARNIGISGFFCGNGICAFICGLSEFVCRDIYGTLKACLYEAERPIDGMGSILLNC